MRLSFMKNSKEFDNYLYKRFVNNFVDTIDEPSDNNTKGKDTNKIPKFSDKNMILTKNISFTCAHRTRMRLSTLFVGNQKDYFNHHLEPNIQQANMSYIITDKNGVLYKKYKDYLDNAGYDVLCLNLMDKDNSLHYNPFIHIVTEEECIYEMAEVILRNDKDFDMNDEQINAKTMLLASAIEYIYQNEKPDKQSFSSVIELLSNNTKWEYLNELKEENDENNKNKYQIQLKSKFSEIENKEEITKYCIQKLEKINQPIFCEDDEFDMDTFLKHKTAVFLIYNENEEHSIIPMFITQYYSKADDLWYNASKDTGNPEIYHVQIMIDDIHIGWFSVILFIVGQHYNCGTSLCCDSMKKLKEIYKDIYEINEMM